jgi:hypothetical protein
LQSGAVTCLSIRDGDEACAVSGKTAVSCKDETARDSTIGEKPLSARGAAMTDTVGAMQA